MLITAWSLAVWANGSDPTRTWLTGRKLHEALAQPENVFWRAVPLRPSLVQFCRAQRVALLIDRRVDPGRELNVELRAVPVREVVQQVAQSGGFGVCLFGPVVYVGPAEITSRLRTVAELLHQQARELPPETAQLLLEAKPLAWHDFSTPRDLLGRLAAENGIEIAGLEQVPHDLWASADLPPLPLVDRFSLVACQFDLTFHISDGGKTLTLAPVPDDVAIVRSYTGGSTPDETVKRWAAALPGARFEVVGSEIVVRGLLEDHERMTALRGPARLPPSSARPAPAAGGEKTRFTANVVNKPLGKVLEYFAGQLDVELRIDRQALEQSGVSLDELISFSVKEATFDELFEAVLGPVGCTFSRNGNTVQIEPAVRKRQ